MSDIAIKFENVSKLYRLGTVGTGTLSHDLKRWWITSVRGKEDPYLKIGETNDRSSKGNSDYVYALKDIDFEVKQGDVLGIIGKNGAGKSTLLKLLSRVTAPTTGKIYTKGRIASLLEVGTGFHPELTGRENIYMNGTIMGMKKWEIDRKLDEIVDFSGCERYLDTPVKRYSSGMMVRLGFAVAAHLEPEILVVDEVLAVGDAEFQKKAIGKMQDVSKGEGRSVLFVSHNMAAVRSLCKNGLVLSNGQINYSGTIDKCVDYYLSDDIFSGIKQHCLVSDKERNLNYTLIREIEYEEIVLENDPQTVSNEEPLLFKMTFRRKNQNVQRCRIGIAIENSRGETLGISYSEVLVLPKDGERFQVEVIFENHQLSRGMHSVTCSISDFDYVAAIRDFDVVHHPICFEVNYLDKDHKHLFSSWPASSGIAYKPARISNLTKL